MRYITWGQVNLDDGDIRVLKGKRKKKRPVVMSANLICWLKICDQSRPIYPAKNFRRKMATVKRVAGFKGGTKVSKKRLAEEAKLKPWVRDYGRHTGISCHVREHGDIGRTATLASTSTGMIEEDYLGLVLGIQAKEFWSIMP